PLVPETLANIFFFLSFSPFTSILGKKGVYFYVTRSVRVVKFNCKSRFVTDLTNEERSYQTTIGF
ncbi:hypothetical protein, partial [Leptospira interrogans]|uniref:hypothetical protein n=1 Tax=Leptospira interrogans TaxID=173 RepID=UPI001B8ACA95